MENIPGNHPDRRRFLEWSIWSLGGLIGASLAGTGAAYFVAPAFRKEAEEWLDIGAAADVPRGVPAQVLFTERKRDAWIVTERVSYAWVVTSNNRDFIVFDPRCTHLACPYRWDDKRKQFLCPCHTAIFDVDGRVIAGPPPRPLDRYPVKVVGGRLLILPRPIRSEHT